MLKYYDIKSMHLILRDNELREDKNKDIYACTHANREKVLIIAILISVTSHVVIYRQ